MQKTWKTEHDFSEGNLFAIVTRTQRDSTKASIQIDTDASFDGTTAVAKLVQSNDLDLDPALWHDLPEEPLTMPTNAGSSLLSTFSFTTQYLALVIEAGDASTGVGKLTNKFNSNT
jgi:hypothetical protein